ncbi:hypothetical protein PENTCL1PPCAC_18197 [Pristionchus entomophagus]|uniref:Cysteine-rich DPF motif domain-containing protein 1 n=1 Tax=Pristionchus entomophagus TaxID=358040 RepID=A0AAV5TP54_9BILA|nr:hypothetical protein PENTCL1PPCAC_18197 [Pristionchus entomophagus]
MPVFSPTTPVYRSTRLETCSLLPSLIGCGEDSTISFNMSDGEDRGERKRKSMKNKDKKEKKSRRDRSHEEGEEVLGREPHVEDSSQSAMEVDQQTPSIPPPTVLITTTVNEPPIDPSTSNEKKDDDDDMKIDPWIPFDCSVCKLNAKCYYRELRCSDGFYSSPVFFMRDPFTAPPRVRGRKPVLNDYVVIGALCEICSQPTCLAKSCTLYFGAHFCSSCVGRERRRFPEKLVEGVTKARSALSAYVDPAMKEEKEEKKEEKTK